MLKMMGGGDLVSCRYSFCPLMWISRVFGRNLEGDRLPFSEAGRSCFVVVHVLTTSTMLVFSVNMEKALVSLWHRWKHHLVFLTNLIQYAHEVNKTLDRPVRLMSQLEGIAAIFLLKLHVVSSYFNDSFAQWGSDWCLLVRQFDQCSVKDL